MQTNYNIKVQILSLSLSMYVYIYIYKYSVLILYSFLINAASEWMVFAFEPYRARLTEALGKALCAPCSVTKLQEPCSFRKCPDDPYIYFPNILRVQKEGA